MAGPVDTSTVYRTLEALEGIGYVTHVHMGHGPGVYHVAPTPTHHHLVCESCGTAVDVPARALRERCPPATEPHGFDGRCDPLRDRRPLPCLCGRTTSERATESYTPHDRSTMATTTRSDTGGRHQLAPGAGYLSYQLWERRWFIRELAFGNIIGKHATDMLGILWWVLNPLMMTGVFFLVFGIILDGRRGRSRLPGLPAGRRVRHAVHVGDDDRVGQDDHRQRQVGHHHRLPPHGAADWRR